MNPTHNQVTAGVTVTPADVLRGAARYLELHGWIQGNYRDEHSDAPFPPCCAAGAIVMAAHGRWIDVFNTTSRDYENAINALADYLNHHGPHPAPEPAFGNDPADYHPEPYDWNDHPHRTAEQVTTALRAAADHYEHHHPGSAR